MCGGVIKLIDLFFFDAAMNKWYLEALKEHSEYASKRQIFRLRHHMLKLRYYCLFHVYDHHIRALIGLKTGKWTFLLSPILSDNTL